MQFFVAVATGLAVIASGVAAAPSNPIAKRCTNSASDRSCWSDSFDLSTNYYENVPDTGVTREVRTKNWDQNYKLIIPVLS